MNFKSATRTLAGVFLGVAAIAMPALDVEARDQWNNTRDQWNNNRGHHQGPRLCNAPRAPQIWDQWQQQNVRGPDGYYSQYRDRRTGNIVFQYEGSTFYGNDPTCRIQNNGKNLSWYGRRDCTC